MLVLNPDYQRRVVRLVAVLVLMSAGASAEAAIFNTCDGTPQIWHSKSATMNINTYSMPPGGVWDVDFQYAMDKWNSAGGSAFRFILGRDDDTTVDNENGITEVYWGDDIGDDALARTYYRMQCSWTRYWFFGWHYTYYTGIIEADIGFNVNYPFHTGPMVVGSGSNSFRQVALHELGHALGLEHNSALAIMDSKYPNAGPLGHYNDSIPHADDAVGVRFLYPDSSTKRDAAVGKYAWDSSTKQLLSFTSMGPVPRGGSRDIYYTLENLSTQTETAVVDFYISTNNYISTADRWLGTTGWSMPPGSVINGGIFKVTIPANLAPGSYYLGYMVDRSNSIPEANEGNNFVAVDGPISVY